MLTPIKISPLAPRRFGSGAWTFQKIHNYFSGHNSWSSVNSTDVSTTTTWLDYAGVHNLANPSATNQPTVVNPDTDFNGLKTYSFVTDDYLIKNTPNYGAGQTTGSIWLVIKASSSFQYLFSCADVSTNSSQFTVYLVNSNKLRFYNHNGTVQFAVEANLTLINNTVYIVEVQSDGGTISIYINDILVPLTLLSGVNSGQWLAYANTLSNLDNIAIGAKINTAPLYSNGTIVYVGNFPLLSSDNRTLMFNALNSIFNVY